MAAKRVRGRSEIESALEEQLVALGIGGWEMEFRFCPERRWRFDFAWPKERLAVEIEGGAWIAGRHVRGKGYEQDCEKYNEAALRGWRLLRFTARQVRDGTALAHILRALGQAEREGAPVRLDIGVKDG